MRVGLAVLAVAWLIAVLGAGAVLPRHGHGRALAVEHAAHGARAGRRR